MRYAPGDVMCGGLADHECSLVMLRWMRRRVKNKTQIRDCLAAVADNLRVRFRDYRLRRLRG